MPNDKIYNTIPRHRLRPRFKDLHDGEHAWASLFHVNVLQDGSVYLDIEGEIRFFAGSQPWPDHQKYGDMLIEYINNEYWLHIFGKDCFVPKNHDDLDILENERYVKISKIIDHGPNWEVCGTCGGLGIIEKEK